MLLKHLLLSFFLIISCSKEQDKMLPEQRALTESVYSSVTIQPDSLYHAYAIVAGILDTNLVEEGHIVLKGETLIQIITNGAFQHCHIDRTGGSTHTDHVAEMS